ncbi:hypothetical protein NCLIV_060990 [Neospora caninum Liverpool]|uniref:NADPH--hemoprotein reductase n=1 Tax=Neospora caninum (strain Liverpool) TaxID=572307 RepID=F0VPM8_NEOCL|nr:hypothetical protein NCLIV_060990 [Neospora caninum Liverpool]CBZ55675.1 hypothetical protein NCLIV_060990 [Neospora caninum Liverpool]CEL70417.1 TPA: Nitric oxide synthase [Neospora caninum Liverpool]|eukprot:XP_003885701.1 hypothetical protein NCLIV_060990 [Neospora caninum Liverpool]
MNSAEPLLNRTPFRLLLLSSIAVGTAAALYLLFRPRKSRSRWRERACLSSALGTGASAGAAEAEDDEETETACKETLFVYFGSQSGTAEAFSEELASAVAEEIHELRNVEVVDLEDFDPHAFLAQKYKVLVVATYGEGEPTDNARTFFEWLKAYTKSLKEGSAPSSPMRGWCAVFGLGSSEYERFNRSGRRAFKMLDYIAKRQQELHAPSRSLLRLMCPLGLGDGAKDSDVDFADWRQEHFVPALKQIVKTNSLVKGEATEAAQGDFACATPSSGGFEETGRQTREDFARRLLQGDTATRTGGNQEGNENAHASGLSTQTTSSPELTAAAVDRLQKRVEAWARRGTDAAFRLRVGPSREALLAEQRRVEDEAARKAGKPPASLTQVPNGTSAKAFFHMHAFPVKRIRQLRQQITFSSSCAGTLSASSPEGRTQKREADTWRQTAPEESTVEVELDLTDLPSVQYRAADNMYCLHKSAPEEIAWWHTFLGFKDQGVALSDYVHWLPSPDALASALASSSLTYGVPFPTPCTVEEALGCFCNLTGLHPKFGASCLSLWIDDPEERTQWLRLFCDDAAAQHVYEACVKAPLLSLRDLLPTLAPSFRRPWVPRLASSSPSARLPSVSVFAENRTEPDEDRELGVLLSLLAAAHAPRAYTTASSPKALASDAGMRSLSLCVGLVAEQREGLGRTTARLEENGFKIFGASSAVRSERRGPLFQQEGRPFFGACSSFITQQLRPGDEVKALIKPSSFRLPADVRVPVIMVGAGTGIAPFIAFLREFECIGGWGAPVVLFFGCQRENKDFLYRDELLRYRDQASARTASSQGQKHILTHLFVAFSREPGKPKTYVQDQIAEQKDLVFQLIQQNATVYICGRTAMAAGVTETLARVAAEKFGGDEARARDFVHNLRKSKRIVEEVWA